ncbi:hypothetical protein [Streptosporangium sp. NPDC000396]|uniref:hypothetical protein n=1 Tax=Streptosporangium sp. NPDC000396 TaxID=3366185 RepID=UPI0036CAFB8D
MTSFAGRRHELSQVRQMLSQSRLVTLTGAGGIGKSRLALRAAHPEFRTVHAIGAAPVGAGIRLPGRSSGAARLEAAEEVRIGEGFEYGQVPETLAALLDKSIPTRDDRLGHVRYRMPDSNWSPPCGVTIPVWAAWKRNAAAVWQPPDVAMPGRGE